MNHNQTSISVVIPVYNEAESLPLLFASLEQSLGNLGTSSEIIFTDDGSQDDSFALLREYARSHPEVRVIKLKRNFGQTAALAAGIAESRGSVIVTLDADLENDLADIPKLLALIDEGFDIVSGNRVGRWQGEWRRRLLSWGANKVISALSGVTLRDTGCTLKAYRREVFDHLKLYGQMHRMIPAYASWMGYRVTELAVRFTPRRFGRSHYTTSRFLSVLIDLVTLKFMLSYLSRPAHFFGKVGFFFISLGVLAGAWAVYFKLANAKDFVETPLPILMTFLIIMGCLAILMGVFGEILTRLYFEGQKKEPYLIQEKITFS